MHFRFEFAIVNIESEQGSITWGSVRSSSGPRTVRYDSGFTIVLSRISSDHFRMNLTGPDNVCIEFDVKESFQAIDEIGHLKGGGITGEFIRSSVFNLSVSAEEL